MNSNQIKKVESRFALIVTILNRSHNDIIQIERLVGRQFTPSEDADSYIFDFKNAQSVVGAIQRLNAVKDVRFKLSIDQFIQKLKIRTMHGVQIKSFCKSVETKG